MKSTAVVLAVLFLMIGSTAALADSGGPLTLQGPAAPHFPVRSVDALPLVAAQPFDREFLRREDLERIDQDLPPRFALPEEVFITPGTDGVWEELDGDFDVWRLRVQAPGALSLNFGFDAFRLPKGARLAIHPALDLMVDDKRGVHIFTQRDNDDHGQLWTPVVLADDVVLELVMPKESRHDFELALTSVNRGYRLFGEEADKAGTCNIDVVCPEGDDWRLEINSVAVYSTGGSTFCTGFMVNNTAQDETPLFQTAYHCQITASNAASLVVYWNFQSPLCGQQGGGTLTDFQTGSVFRAGSAASDFTLVELDDPPNPDHNVSFAGWNHGTEDFPSVVGIHHPNTDEKSISFENDPTTTTSYLQTAVPGDGSHIRVIDWDLGTTEPGSSGSPLFDNNHRVVGQLHGGYAACGNDLSDWYGRVSYSWDGATSATRLRDWLDPGATGAVAVDTHAPWATGLAIDPGSGFSAEGPVGGPFTPTQMVFTLTNRNAVPMDWSAAADVAWVDVVPATGTMATGGTVDVTVSLNTVADALATGQQLGSVTFLNLTDGQGDAGRPLALQVGVPELVDSEPLDTDPGWTTSGLWAYGIPLGGGGEHGGADPTAGATGANVYGYNLDGDYENNLAEQHLTSTAFDCSNVTGTTLRFQRWLGVEVPEWDHASVSVSNDGVVFTTVWSNFTEFADVVWTPVELDISAVADGQPTVYLRWTMGTTDGSWQYCGWNIDDVEIWGLADGLSSVPGTPDAGLSLASHPNPFNPSTTLAFTLEKAGRTRLEVFDTAGRRVATLVDETRDAGDHVVTWQPRQLPSGVYFARLRSGGQEALQRMTLLK